MKYSYNWLRELSGTKRLPEKVADGLTMKSMEVEGLERIGKELDGVVVGKILEIRKHPNADKLQLTRIDVGTNDYLSIICGAHNISVGDKVPVAMIGANLPNGIEIKEVSIRGEKSFGMLCARDELGFGSDHSGIMILSEKAKAGMPLAKYLELDDSVLEIKVLPDRSHDAMSHVGVAREIAAIERADFDYDYEGLKLSSKKSKSLSVEIKDKKLCSRYIGAVMTDVEIKDSPGWMKARLRTCGIKAINNVVDATNYVMLELGNPLHAFDFSEIKSEITNDKFQISNNSKNQNSKSQKAKIIVRGAKKGEKMVLLDDSEIELQDSDLLITNDEMPLALAGIMGGRDSGINENTKTIVLESANFNATNIRRTRTRLGVKTESSDRFEKDIDPNLAEKAMVRIIEILERTAGAKLEGVIDVYPDKIKPWKIRLDLGYANRLLGENIPTKEIVKILNSLGIDTKHQIQNTKYLDCTIPTFRVDMRTQEDLIEDIGRIWGYEKINSQPLVEPVEPARIDEQLTFEREAKRELAGLGFDEIYNYSFYSQRDADVCGLGDVKHFELANPMNPEQELARVSLMPNILKNIRENLKHFESLRIFEMGRVYYPNNSKVEEKRMLVMAQVLEEDSNADTFYNLKGAAEDLMEAFGIADKNRSAQVKLAPWTQGGSMGRLEPATLAHPGRSAEIEINGENIGIIAEINPAVLSKYKISKRVAMAEIDLQKLLKVLPKTKTYEVIGKFPTVVRDISLFSPKDVTVAQISDSIKKSGGELVLEVELFDIFRKDNENKNSYAFHITFGSNERTLESGEIDAIMEKITADLERDLNTEIRK